MIRINDISKAMAFLEEAIIESGLQPGASGRAGRTKKALCDYKRSPAPIPRQSRNGAGHVQPCTKKRKAPPISGAEA